MSHSDPTYSGEVLLLRWSDSDASGMTITLMLDDGPDGHDVHPFKAFRSGKANGQRFAAVLVPIVDDESIGERPAPQTRKLRPNARMAAMLCNEIAFMGWMNARTPDEARQKLCARLGIESRRQLDDEPYRSHWVDFLERYTAWQNGKG